MNIIIGILVGLLLFFGLCLWAILKFSYEMEEIEKYRLHFRKQQEERRKNNNKN